MSSLADTILGNPDDAARLPQIRQGVVTQASPLMVRVGAATSSLACRALDSYAPVSGDVVSVLVIAGDRLVLGATARGSSSLASRVAALEADAALKGFKGLVNSQLIAGNAALIIGSVIFDTGGYGGVGATSLRIPTGEPHAVSMFMRADGAASFPAGAQLFLNTGTSGTVAYDVVPAGHAYIQVSTVTTFNAGDYVQPVINLFGNNVYCSGYLTAVRVSKGS